MHSFSLHTLALVVAVGLLSAGVVRADDKAPNEKLNKKIDNFSFKDAAGKPFALYDLKDKKAVVVVFLSFECPVSTNYSEPLAQLNKDYADRGVAFLGVSANLDDDAAQVAKHAKDYKIPFPVFKDDKLAAVDALKVQVTPEAFVLDHNFVLRYRGRIDNGWAARLKKNQQITRHDVRQALDELLAGKAVSEPITQAVGCAIQRDSKAKADGKVTYYRDVLPILQNRCQECHRPGEVGPFSLLTYRQAVNWASDIKEYTQSRKMPPWKPVEGPAFNNDRKMTDKEIATLAAWVDEGTPEGNPKDAPPPRKFVEGWQLGTPDLVLTPDDDFTLGGSGRDAFRVYVMPTNLDEDKYVTAVEVRPSNGRIAHHALIFLDRTGKGRELTEKEKQREKKDAEQDKGAGYSSTMGVGFSPQGGLGGWAPGNLARPLPEGTGYLLPKGSDVVVQMHYHRNGRVEKDRPTFGLYFAKKPVEMRFQGRVIPGRFLFIPADQERFRVTGSIPVSNDTVLHSVMPHMHMLGKEIKVTVTPPEDKPFTLIAIKDWDYNWQETYFLKEPITLKAGTKLDVEAFYDNSAKNPNNPFNPPKAVRFGEQTDNEMCFVFLGVTPPKKAPPKSEEKKP